MLESPTFDINYGLDGNFETRTLLKSRCVILWLLDLLANDFWSNGSASFKLSLYAGSNGKFLYSVIECSIAQISNQGS